MKQIRFSKLSYVLLLFVLVACQAQATPTSAPTSLPPTLAPAAAPTQTNNMFTSKIYQLPMSMNIGPQWTVAEQYPDLITLEGPAELGFIIVTDTTKIADSQAPYSIIPFPNDFTTWINTNGLFQIVKTQAVVIGGFTGTQFDAKGTAACNDTQATHNPGKRNWIFLQQTGWNCRPDEHWNFIYLDVVQGKQLLIINSGGPATDEEFNLGLAASQKVLDTVVFSKP